MLAVVAVLALVLYACSGSGSKKQQPAADGKSSPTASQSSVPTASGSQSAASGGASGGPSSANGSAPSGSAGGASGSASASGGANGGSNGAAGGVNGGANTTGGTGPAGGSTSGPGCQLSLSLSSQSPAYANGVDPQFTVAVVNKGTADCDVDVSPKSLVLNVYSGPDHVWSSADCATGGKDLRGIAPGGLQTITFSWNRTRSSAGCTAGSSSAKLGMYFGVVSLGPGSGSNAPAAQSQPKSFELKTGS